MHYRYRKYYVAVRRRSLVIILVGLVVVLVAYGVSERRGPVHQVHFNYLVSLAEREERSDFRYDGYYALEATDLFATTLGSWITSPASVLQAYDEAKVSRSEASLRDLVKTFSANKRGPQVVAVTVKGKDEEEVERLALGMQRVVRKNIEEYGSQEIPGVSFEVTTQEMVASQENVVSQAVALGAGLVTVLLLINWVLLRESLNEDSD